MSSPKWAPAGPVGRIVNQIEETAIALILALMVGVTFVNVVLRYGFNSTLIWGQELVLILFAWLVLLGVSYGVKITAHLGVDALTNAVPPVARRVMALLAGLACVVFAALLLKGAWDFYANYANLPKTTGRWFPTGLDEMRLRDFRGYKPTEQVPFPEFLRGPLESWLLIDGDEPFDTLPVALPYMIVPIGAALLLYRFVEASIGIWRGTRDALIVSHEAEDAVDQARVQEGEG